MSELITRKDQSHNIPRRYAYAKDFGDIISNFFNNWADYSETNSTLKSLDPKIEVCENAKNITVLAEIPGVKEEDLDMEISADGYLTISGEKKHEQKQDNKNSYFSELSYGTFSRTIPLPWDLKFNNAEAEFHNGILSVIIPKSTDEQCKKKKITLKKQKA